MVSALAMALLPVLSVFLILVLIISVGARGTAGVRGGPRGSAGVRGGLGAPTGWRLAAS